MRNQSKRFPSDVPGLGSIDIDVEGDVWVYGPLELMLGDDGCIKYIWYTKDATPKRGKEKQE